MASTYKNVPDNCFHIHNQNRVSFMCLLPTYSSKNQDNNILCAVEDQREFASYISFIQFTTHSANTSSNCYKPKINEH